MKIALLALAALMPSLASANDPEPYVLHEGRAVHAAPAAAAANTNATRQSSAFGTSAIHAGVTTPAPAVSSSGSGASPNSVSAPSGARSFHASKRSISRRRGVAADPGGTGPASGGGGTGSTTSAPDAPPAWATPGAKILTAGQQPVYSDPTSPQRTLSIEGGGFIAIDQSRANDVGRAPGISWAPPDKAPSAGPSGAGGNAITANGPAVGTTNTSNATRTQKNSGRGAEGDTGFDGSF